MKVREIMQTFPATVKPDDTVWLAAETMLWARVHHLPVVDGQELVGLLSERDVAVHDARPGASPQDPVAAIMKSQPQCAGPDDSVTEVAARLAEAAIDCLLVVEKRKLLGLVTTTDLLRLQVQQALHPEPVDGPTVAEVMTPDPVTVRADDRLLDAAARMKQLGIRHLPVVDGDGYPLGMLSDRDVRTAIGDPARAFRNDQSETLESLRVGQVMSAPLTSTTPETSCAALARTFAHLRASAMGVTDGAGRLVGIVSYIDLLPALARLAK
jgi:CBS domain-containing protein